MAPREHLDALRQQARLALARDRAKGAGRCGPEAVAEAWDACLTHDAACEEAAAGLVRAYGSQGLRRLAVQAYERCRAGLEELGLQPSPALQAVRAATLSTPAKPSVAAVGPREERRVVAVLFVDVAAASGAFGDDPEDLRDLVGDSLAGVMAAVEGLGGTVTSVSGTGLQALFGAPDAHEDDPSAPYVRPFGRSPPRPRARPPYGPGWRRAQPLWPRCRPGPTLIARWSAGLSAPLPPCSLWPGQGLCWSARTRGRPAEGAFDWGADEEVLVAKDTKPLTGAYLERPRPGGPARPLRLRRAGAARGAGGRAFLARRGAPGDGARDGLGRGHRR